MESSNRKKIRNLKITLKEQIKTSAFQGSSMDTASLFETVFIKTQESSWKDTTLQQ